MRNLRNAISYPKNTRTEQSLIEMEIFRFKTDDKILINFNFHSSYNCQKYLNAYRICVWSVENISIKNSNLFRNRLIACFVGWLEWRDIIQLLGEILSHCWNANISCTAHIE